MDLDKILHASYTADMKKLHIDQFTPDLDPEMKAVGALLDISLFRQLERFRLITKMSRTEAIRTILESFFRDLDWGQEDEVK